MEHDAEIRQSVPSFSVNNPYPMFKRLIAPMKLTGLLILLVGIAIILSHRDHLYGIGPYITILGTLFLLTDFLSDSTGGTATRAHRSMEIGLLLLVTAVVVTVILDITGVISLHTLLSM
jgi:hypothetical protein